MTEEIIIDGVDVSGCCCYENGKCLWTKRYYENNIVPDCEKVKNCYYKQLKRLEQENKELRKMLSKEPKAMQAFQIAYSGLKKENEVLWGMVKDYKTALEEIRNYCNRIEQGSVIGTQDCLINSIKNITNEVLNDKEL